MCLVGCDYSISLIPFTCQRLLVASVHVWFYRNGSHPSEPDEGGNEHSHVTPSKRRRLQSQQQKEDLFNAESAEHFACFELEQWHKSVKDRSLDGLIKRINSERASLLEKTEIECAGKYGILVTDLGDIVAFMKMYRAGYGKKLDESLVADSLTSSCPYDGHAWVNPTYVQ